MRLLMYTFILALGIIMVVYALSSIQKAKIDNAVNKFTDTIYNMGYKSGRIDMEYAMLSYDSVPKCKRERINKIVDSIKNVRDSITKSK